MSMILSVLLSSKKTTAHYVMGVFQEYSETQILQMIGRAGRPQVSCHLLLCEVIVLAI